MSALTDTLIDGLNSLLASGTQIPASRLRAYEALVVGAIGTLEARARGNKIHYTNGVPGNALGIEGDLGVNKDNGDFYQFVNGQFVLLFNGTGKVGAFTPIAQNAFGTHPAFTGQDTLNDWLLGNRTGGTTPPTPAKPTITGFLPLSGAQGSTVVLTGTNFTGATVVSINSGAVATFTVDSATQITAVLSGSQTTGRVRVTTPAGTAVSSSDFAVTVPPAAPTITSFSPASGAAGSTVVITGTNFTGATLVSVNSASVASFVVDSTTQITAVLSSNQATGKVRVTTPAGTGVSTADFMVSTAAAPKILAVMLGDSLVAGRDGGGSVPATFANGGVGGESVNAWPNQVATYNPNYTVHNEGVSGDKWADLSARKNDALRHFTPAAMAAHDRCILFIGNGTNPAWKDSADGITNAQAAKAFVDEMRAALPASVEIHMSTIIPFDGQNTADVDDREQQFNRILLNLDTVNSAQIGLYAAVDKVYDVRATSVFANRAACLDGMYYSTDKVHLIEAGYFVIATEVVKGVAAPGKVYAFNYSPPAPDPNAPWGNPYPLLRGDMQTVGGNNTPGEEPGRQIIYIQQGSSSAQYFTFNFNRGFSWVYGDNEFIPPSYPQPVVDVWVDGASVGQFNLTKGVEVLNRHPNGGIHEVRIYPVAGLIAYRDGDIQRFRL